MSATGLRYLALLLSLTAAVGDRAGVPSALARPHLVDRRQIIGVDLVLFGGRLLKHLKRTMVLIQGLAFALFARGGVVNRDALLHPAVTDLDRGLVHLLEVLEDMTVAIVFSLDGSGAGVGVVSPVYVVDLALLGLLLAVWGQGGEDGC
jgi:hypothetical protein